ncbi:MAG: hypothetical protein COV36_01795 [Alphaproteobacteria bacterium CG11_big_fil_rev_8_21_14_0_20_44_7]|nr:MAG: hypothetical protein COV36_01795 [Alphaproteobacteria bacterium CG11_big_fil_rev_8_21_14_0_20_44_7]
MKVISTELRSHLEGEATTLATCWKLTCRDGDVLGFTDHDEELLIDSVNYIASSGFNPTAVQSTSSLAVDNLDVDGVLDDASITEENIFSGKYDFAEIEIFMVNYADLSQGALNIKRGWIGEVSYSKQHFIAEVRGLTEKLNQKIGDIFSPTCRANLGDAKCGADLEEYTVSGEITDVSSRQVFADSALVAASGYYNFGRIIFTSGENQGLSMEIKDYREGGAITLVLPMAFTVDVGDAFDIIAGCDKYFSTCVYKFDNAVNFRGEPHVLGLDKIMQTASTRN